jgi:hypothetical protein
MQKNISTIFEFNMEQGYLDTDMFNLKKMKFGALVTSHFLASCKALYLFPLDTTLLSI